MKANQTFRCKAKIAPKNQTQVPSDPYGIFTGAKITDADIKKVTKSWDLHANKIVNEL